MTEKEAIKILQELSLERCETFGFDCGNCDKCEVTIAYDMAIEALGLVKQQQTEIEAIKDKRAIVFKLSEEQINEVNEDVLKSVEYNERKIKAEAYKEFAERLKSSIYIDTNLLVYECREVKSLIDDIVKEMVGDNK